MHEGRRLLQRLEQPVRDLVVHRVRPLEHEDATGGLKRRPACSRDYRLLDVADAHHVRAGGPHPREVRVRAGEYPRAGGVRIGLLLHQQLGGEGPGGGSLPGARRSMEEVGVRRIGALAQRRCQNRARVRVVLGAGDRDGRAHPAVTAARAASTAAITSAWISSAGRFASIRRQRSGSASASRSYARATRS